MYCKEVLLKAVEKGVETMTAVLRRSVLEEAYLDYQKLIFDVVHKFIARYGGDFEELLGEANLIFILAFNSYNYKAAKFSTWLYSSLWHGLQDYKRKEYRTTHFKNHSNKVSFEFEEDNHPVTTSNEIIDLFDEFSNDAKEVIHLIFNAPPSISNKALRKSKPRITKGVVKNYIHQRFGWKHDNINKVFQEIQEVLNG